MARLFDAYYAVDWSSKNVPSANKPSKDSLWVGEKLANGGSAESYFKTRHACKSYLKEKLLEHVQKKERVFVGFDFAYGYPKGFARALGLKGVPWKVLWNQLNKLITDTEENANNRFEVASLLNERCGGKDGPLWGHPVGREYKTLTIKSPKLSYPFSANGVLLERYRIVDNMEKSKGIQPIWKLAGPASVGGQCLVGIPIVCQLRDDEELSRYSKVWPFETGFTKDPVGKGPCILHCEIWPGNIPLELDKKIEIRDQAQVKAVVSWLSWLDDKNQLGIPFC
ncbi:MAG: Precorrin-8X methylmutase [Candidatus Woesebacteria bacterium GW2011_GWA1_37_7]|uniref:Precorrin-8X methylmutase n=1 Tax=Candidatus Woesebacteria bacterium GW2011_GWA1_37_7 TaxID=1618545 RepID=A0A0G0JJE8_9BACT|nr:MAG: Precorrin-8X methylmutase [Candidatus Woesebacteria bacterium GW2011_GWA1_37_7]